MENCTAHDIYMKEDIYLDMMQQGIHLYVKCKLGKLHKAVVYEEYEPNILSDYSEHKYHDNYSYFEEDNYTKCLPYPVRVPKSKTKFMVAPVRVPRVKTKFMFASGTI